VSIRVLVAEDMALVRSAIRCLLEQVPEIEVVAEAANGIEAVRAIAQHKPDVVLMDISMPELNGIEAIRRTAKMRPPPRIVILSVHTDREYVRAALAAGAAGYVPKTATREELIAALFAVARGNSWLSPPIAGVVIGEMLAGSPEDREPDLTERQREVLQLIAEGHSTKEIARRLHVSVKTIETHRAQIMQRLDIHHVAGLVRYAIRRKIV
jgi:two-component system, NarL family, response regulator LiaR